MSTKSERQKRINKILRNWEDIVTMEDYRTQKRYISNFMQFGKFIGLAVIAALAVDLLVR